MTWAGKKSAFRHRVHPISGRHPRETTVPVQNDTSPWAGDRSQAVDKVWISEIFYKCFLLHPFFPHGASLSTRESTVPRATSPWLPRAHDGAHLPRARTALSGLPAGWNRACASRPALTPSPPCALTPRCICCPMRRLHRVQHHRALDDGDGAREHRVLTSTSSATSLQAEYLFAAIEIFMLSEAAQAPAAARPRQGRCRLGVRARPWLQAVPVARGVGWTSPGREELRFGAPSERAAAA